MTDPNVIINDIKLGSTYSIDQSAYENIRKVASGQKDDYTTGRLRHYAYFKNYSKEIVVDLSKQQAFDANPKAKQQVSFTGNLGRVVYVTMIFFILEELKETILSFLQGTVRVL